MSTLTTPKAFLVNNIISFKSKMLHWANQCSIFCLLDNQQYNFEKPAFECLLAVGCQASFESSHHQAFEKLQQFYAAQQGNWLFGHLAYDLKNDIEKLQSTNIDEIGFADVHFFVPETMVKLTNTTVEIYGNHAEKIFAEIQNTIVTKAPATEVVAIKNRLTQQAYTNAVKKLQQHILHGDCYEINFCHEFYAENAAVDAVDLYKRLVALSPNPFASLYKVNNRYCICASPERYLKKEGDKLVSQPIKGTSKRNLQNTEKDAHAKKLLTQSQKERSENVMVVDLVRNDLSKICQQGTVKVDELFGVYSFPQVHQMISTISGQLQPGLNWIDAVKATFPMGSMTGAPKKKVMELIEQYEQTKRGLFSGSIGYITPNEDFDFNVVIRSIFYNASTKYLSFMAGSAITHYSDAANEYEECLLKVQAIKDALAS
jgi:para-aminobenzoate synthetase component I